MVNNYNWRCLFDNEIQLPIFFEFTEIKISQIGITMIASDGYCQQAETLRIQRVSFWKGKRSKEFGKAS